MLGERMMQSSITSVARALASPSRLYVLQSLGEEGLSLTEAARRAGLATSTASHHLGVLLDVGLVARRRRGREMIYRWSDTRCSISFSSACP
jgi:DNA-binding transcriptional ArsR family regulator